MRNAISSPADNDETLKIFMAPEFYFRGVNGAYSFDVASRIIPKMGDLGTNKSTHQHWLFVFGTAVAASEEEVTYCPTCKFSPNGVTFNLDSTTGRTQAVCATNPAHKLVTGTFGAEVHNVALIKKGADSHIVAKEYVSHIDYEMNKVTVVQDTSSRRTRRTLGVIAPQGSVESRIASKFQDERMGGAVFTIDGITFGMEICLDHARPTATGGRMVEYANSIQILLIPSFGMEIMFHSCPVGGIIFNVDGHRQESKAVIKGAAGDPASTLATAPSTRGEIEVFGPFPIPRRAQVQTVFTRARTGGAMQRRAVPPAAPEIRLSSPGTHRFSLRSGPDQIICRKMPARASHVLRTEISTTPTA